jgi:peptidyl-tRNA hydrolase, PTH2 family
MKSDLRMLFFVRTDLNMTKGKMAAQVGHATQYLITKQYLGIPTIEFLDWLNSDSIKICLKVSSEEELLKFNSLGKKLGINTELVTDKGFTLFDGVETRTAVGWGPILKETHVDYTSHLKLL